MDSPSDRVCDPGQVDYGELPELTRGLRALGSSRHGVGSGALPSQFFQPLVEARRRAAEARDAAARVRAFDAAALLQALDRVVEKIVAGWRDTRPSARRALRAELTERVAGYARALRELSEQAAAVVSADETTRLERWRAWTLQLAATFDAADRSWIALESVAGALPPRPKP